MNSPCYYVDVGSTVIKGIGLNGTQLPVNSFVTRTRGHSIADQVNNVLAELGCSDIGNDADIRICSSANGGLNVGLLSLSKKASGSTALRMLEAVGANVRFHHTWRETGKQSAIPVDVLVLVGGIDTFNSRSVESGLERMSLEQYSFDRLVYAGHASAADAMRACLKSAEIVSNPLQESLVPANRDLGSYMRLTYLDDIVSKKELQPLRPVSRVPIEPTPSVVSRAFAQLQTRIPSPTILLDIGGATSDLHFAKELLDDTALNASELASFPGICRHVFTAYGVYDSRMSTITGLLEDPMCLDLLSALYGEQHRVVYQKLLEGEASQWLLFCACIFLALRSSIEGRAEAPRINAGALASLMITGGAAKCVSEEDVIKILGTATGWTPRARVFLDSNYRWWTLGLMDPETIDDDIWRILDG